MIVFIIRVGGAGINFAANFVKNRYSIIPTRIKVTVFSKRIFLMGTCLLQSNCRVRIIERAMLERNKTTKPAKNFI